MNSARLTLLCGVLLFVGGSTSCTSDPERHSFRVHREGGIPVAETRGGPRYEGELFAFDPITTLNQDPADPASLLYRINDMTMDNDGNVYVVDNRSLRIAVFDAEGNYRHSFGRRGSGPGEFRWIEIAWFDGDVFTFWDDSNMRMSLYRRDGAFLDGRKPPNQMRVTKMMSLPGDRLMTWQTTFDSREGYAWTSMEVRILTPDGDTLATIASDEIVTGAAEQRSPLPGVTESVVTGIPFTSNPQVLYDPDRGLAVITGMKPEVHWYDLDGNLTGLYRLPIEVQRVTADIKQANDEYRRQMSRESAARTGREPGPLQKMTYPEYAALWSGGFLDDAGYLWLYAIHLPGREDRPDGSRCYVLDPEGRFLGRSTLKGDRLTVRHGRLISVSRDEETGENIITVFRIRPLAEGLDYPGS
jgi:hypothetical protein